MSGIYFAPEITRDYILSKTSEEEIFERYGIPVTSGMFRSPLRKDLHPTCRFYRSRNGRLVLKDFAGHFHGDCIDLVMQIKGCAYGDALNDIAVTFGIKRGEPRHPAASSIIIGPRATCELRVRSTPWDAQHLEWWEDYGITIDILDRYKVVPVERVWLNGYLYYNRDHVKKPEVVYAYKFGGMDYKIYFPIRETKRFLHNNPDILQGYAQLPEEGDFVIITKALKDVMCLAMFGISAIAPMAETSVVSDSVLEDLLDRFGRVYALYDRDRTGKCALLNLRRRGVIPLMMPKGTTKDFSDMCKLDYARASQYVDDFYKSL
jgi:hypothetical protein